MGTGIETGGSLDHRLQRVLVLGDIEAREPVNRIRRIQPLADRLAAAMTDLGIGDAKVVVARSVGEMALLLSSGEVDLYLDSPLPTLAVQARSGSRVLLRRWAQDEPVYWSVFISSKGSGIANSRALLGKTIAFQERDSTSGFLLPASALVSAGFTLQPLLQLGDPVDPAKIGAFLSGDEENALELLRSGLVDAAVLSNIDLRQLPAELAAAFDVFDRTPAVPRQLISVRSDLEPEIAERIRQILLGLNDEDRRELAKGQPGGGWTWKFDEVSPEALTLLESIAESSASLEAF